MSSGVFSDFAEYWSDRGPAHHGRCLFFDPTFSLKLEDAALAGEDEMRKLLRWFPKEADKLARVKNLLLPYNISNSHWITIDVKLDSSRDDMLFFDSLQPSEHPEVRHKTFISDFNALLDLAARELLGWQGAQAVSRRLVTPFNAMPQQNNGIDCVVFTMLVLSQRCLHPDSVPYHNFQFAQQHIDAVRLYLILELTAFRAQQFMVKHRLERAHSQLLVHRLLGAAATCKQVPDLSFEKLRLFGPDDIESRSPAVVRHDWAPTTIFTANTVARLNTEAFFHKDKSTYMTFQNGLVQAKSVLKPDKSGTSARIEHGFQGHDRQVPKHLLEHQSGVNGAGDVMSHLRETFAWCRAGARRMCHTPGKPVEEHMFITGCVKDRVEMSGPHTRCLTTPAGSCAMLHFDSMVLPCLPPNLCFSFSLQISVSLSESMYAYMCLPSLCVHTYLLSWHQRVSTAVLTAAYTLCQHIFSMVVWGKKTWYFLPSEAVPATPHTIETGEENERIDITPDSHPHLPWLVAVAYIGDVIFVPAFFWHCVISDPGGAPPSTHDTLPTISTHLVPCRPCVHNLTVHLAVTAGRKRANAGSSMLLAGWPWCCRNLLPAPQRAFCLCHPATRNSPARSKQAQ